MCGGGGVEFGVDCEEGEGRAAGGQVVMGDPGVERELSVGSHTFLVGMSARSIVTLPNQRHSFQSHFAKRSQLCGVLRIAVCAHYLVATDAAAPQNLLPKGDPSTLYRLNTARTLSVRRFVVSITVLSFSRLHDRLVLTEIAELPTEKLAHKGENDDLEHQL